VKDKRNHVVITFFSGVPFRVMQRQGCPSYLRSFYGMLKNTLPAGAYL
jgi:hypothetical protein